MSESNKVEGLRVILTLPRQTIVILVTVLLVLIGIAMLLGIGWSILVAFAILPVIFARGFVEEQRILAMKKLVKSLRSRDS